MKYVLFILMFFASALEAGENNPVYSFFQLGKEVNLDVNDFGSLIDKQFPKGMSLEKVFMEIVACADRQGDLTFVRLEYGGDQLELTLFEDQENVQILHEVGFYFKMKKLSQVAYGRSFFVGPKPEKESMKEKSEKE